MPYHKRVSIHSPSRSLDDLGCAHRRRMQQQSSSKGSCTLPQRLQIRLVLLPALCQEALTFKTCKQGEELYKHEQQDYFMEQQAYLSAAEYLLLSV